MASEGGEIAFFDVETTIPLRASQRHALLEFGAILVCPRKLVEVRCFSTLIKPADLSMVSAVSVRCNGITREAVAAAPTFQEVADKVYDILHGRVWAGHNIVRFDCPRIREAFAGIGRPAPEPKGTIDTLTLLRQRFGRRAGDMKMATLASYFGLGQQKHRSLDDVRMNLEVVKYCAAVLFLESSLPDIFPVNNWVSPMATTRSRANRNASPEERTPILSIPSDVEISSHLQMSSPLNVNISGEILNLLESNAPVSETDPSHLMPLIHQMKIDASVPDVAMNEEPTLDSSSEGSSGFSGFLDPEEVSLPSISVSLVPAYRGGSKIVLMHKNIPLQLCCMKLRVRFGVSAKFLDHAGRPRSSIVVDAPSGLCQVLDTCDHLAQKPLLDSGSSSEWRLLVMRRNGFLNSPAIRLNIPTIANGGTATYTTEIYQKEPSGSTQRRVFSRVDAAELDSLFLSGTSIDAWFSLEVYDYQQNAGIRLVANKLIVHSKHD